MNKHSSNQELFEYYNARASEYEEFYWGRSGARIHDPELYTRETLTVRNLLPDLISGNCLDIACGTGFWLPVYEKNCTNITLIDQSENVLVECEKKVNLLRIKDKVEIVQDNLFTHDFKKKTYDCVLTGFLISHFRFSELTEFLHLADNLLISRGRLIIIDSTWNEEVASSGRTKIGTMSRMLSDGQEFSVYKRYFDQDDIDRMSDEHGLTVEFTFWGKVFFLVSAKFSRIR
ncbi:MAG: class I SAM-dependent methyltransferase [Dehalococcoidales bacterium]|nr:MAG: class I SAM-dependent methyltransferase [Dehalococcoidales bacterium]